MMVEIKLLPDLLFNNFAIQHIMKLLNKDINRMILVA